MARNSALVSIPVGRGTATGIDPSLTEQLQESAGVVYKVGDPAAHKFPGRVVFNSTPLGSDPVTDVLFADAGSVRLLAYEDDTVHISSPSAAAFSSLWTLPTDGLHLDIASLNDRAYVVSGQQSDETAPFGAFALRNSTAYRMGLAPVLSPPSGALVGTGITGAFYYWVTEYDNVNSVESAFDFLPNISGFGALGMSPANNTVRLTKPATRNTASATHWRIYRTVDTGAPLIGWLVAQVDINITTYDDTTTDADLVFNDPYRIVSPQGIPESMDMDPQDLALKSITTFEGSLLAVMGTGGFAWTPAGEPHSWPDSYQMQAPTLLGGRETCVRKCGDAAYVCTQHETFRINYLPDDTDAVFSPAIAVEHVANYGTPSPTGMCSFTSWGGAPVLFVASLQGPILIAGKFVDRAVRNIDWANTVDIDRLLHCKAVDNPDDYRVELYFRGDDTDDWRVLHFYYDGDRTERKEGPLPEMAWTGPHLVPGRGCYAVASSGPKKFTAGNAGVAGTVYEENSGTVDTALLLDADGTIPFQLRTQRVYPAGIDGQSRADRLFLHSQELNQDQDYHCTFTAYRENGQSTDYPNMDIPAEGAGLQSNGLNASCVSFDVTVNADGVSGMAPINNIHVRIADVAQSQKTQVV